VHNINNNRRTDSDLVGFLTCAPKEASKHSQRIELREEANAIENKCCHPYTDASDPLKEHSCHVTETSALIICIETAVHLLQIRLELRKFRIN